MVQYPEILVLAQVVCPPARPNPLSLFMSDMHALSERTCALWVRVRGEGDGFD